MATDTRHDQKEINTHPAADSLTNPQSTRQVITGKQTSEILHQLSISLPLVVRLLLGWGLLLLICSTLIYTKVSEHLYSKGASMNFWTKLCKFLCLHVVVLL